MLLDESLAARVSGHTFRVTGAQQCPHLAGRGVGIHLIMLMARWRSRSRIILLRGEACRDCSCVGSS
eukprot:533937-Amphidinium_carterae.3